MSEADDTADVTLETFGLAPSGLLYTSREFTHASAPTDGLNMDLPMQPIIFKAGHQGVSGFVIRQRR